ncbi:MAG: hypothetical protein WD795_14095 [Woeseia sp.]
MWHLLESGALPGDLSCSGRHRCDKWFVWHLILAATATQIALDQIGYLGSRLYSIFGKRKPSAQWLPAGRNNGLLSEALPDCPARRPLQLAEPHKQIARALSARPGHRLTTDDICCLLLLEYPALPARQIRACLDDLVSWRIVQRIEADDGNVFFASPA